jgi:hypothetical protein
MNQVKQNFSTKSSRIQKENFYAYLSSLKRHEKKALNFYLTLDNKYDQIYASNTTLAACSGIGTTTFKKVKTKLCDDGLVTQEQRHMRTNMAEVSEMFKDRKFRTRYSPHLPALRYIPEKYLHTAKKGFISPNKYVYLNSVHNININKKYIYTTSNKTMYIHRHTSSRSKDNVQSRLAPFSKTERVRMGMDLPRYVENLRCLKLTQAGKFKLSAFPEAALRLGENRLLARLAQDENLSNPFSYLYSVANKYCIEKGIQLDRRRSWLLFKENNIEDDEPYYTQVNTIVVGGRVRNVSQENVRTLEVLCDCPVGHPYRHWSPQKTHSSSPSGSSNLVQRPENGEERDPLQEAKKIYHMYKSGELDSMLQFMSKKELENYVRRSTAMWLYKIETPLQPNEGEPN